MFYLPLGQRCLLILSIFLLDSTVHAQDAFLRKTGLWEVQLLKDSISTKDSITIQQCSNTDVEPYLLFSIVPDQEHCSSPKIKRIKNGGLNIQTHCRVNKVKVNSSMALMGNFSSNYQGSVKVEFGKKLLKQAVKELFFNARWLGECPLEMVPGTMRLSNGIIVNVMEAKMAHERETE